MAARKVLFSTRLLLDNTPHSQKIGDKLTTPVMMLIKNKMFGNKYEKDLSKGSNPVPKSSKKTEKNVMKVAPHPKIHGNMPMNAQRRGTIPR